MTPSVGRGNSGHLWPIRKTVNSNFSALNLACNSQWSSSTSWLCKSELNLSNDITSILSSLIFTELELDKVWSGPREPSRPYKFLHLHLRHQSSYNRSHHIITLRLDGTYIHYNRKAISLLYSIYELSQIPKRRDFCPW